MPIRLRPLRLAEVDRAYAERFMETCEKWETGGKKWAGKTRGGKTWGRDESVLGNGRLAPREESPELALAVFERLLSQWALVFRPEPVGELGATVFHPSPDD